MERLARDGIDDPTGKIEQHYFPQEDWERQLADEITDKALLPLIPTVGWLVVLIRSFLKGRSARGELLSLCRHILEICRSLGADVDQLKEQIPTEERMLRLGSVAAERMLWGANEKKRDRFAAVVAGTYVKATTDQQYEDAAYFIRALDELSEDDIRVLYHLHKHQADFVKESHHVDYNRLTDSTQIERVLRSVGDLDIQMEEFFARCARLSGYGLALPLERNGKFAPSEYMFRITLLGRRLIELLG